MGVMRHLVAALVPLSLAACGGGGHSASASRPLGSLADADAGTDAVSEHARPGIPVGITVTAPDLSAQGAVTFSLTDSSNGSFAIDAATGVIAIAGSVDFESTPERTITARATSRDGRFFAERTFVVGIVDSPAPTLEIDFPFIHANYPYSRLGVSGRIVHPEPASISVHASTGAATADGTVTADGRFFVRGVVVVEGDGMALTVRASHAGNESYTKSVSLGRAPDLSIVESLIVDSARDRYLLADRYSGTIVAIGRSASFRYVVSGAGQGAGTNFDEPVGLALDADNDILYVIDRELDAVFRVDPRTGDRSVVSAGSIRTPAVGIGTSLLDATDIVFDASRQTLFVVDDGRNSLVAIDPASGNRTTVSDNNPIYGATMNFWNSIALDTAGNRVITATPSLDDMYGVDLTTGVRTLVSNLARDIPNANRSFRGVTVAPARGAAYLADDFSNAVVRMDLATGVRTSITSSGLIAGLLTHPAIGTGPELEWPTDVLYDADLDRLLVMEESWADPLIEVDEATGNRSMIIDGAVGAGINFKDPSGIVLDPSGRSAYVTDYIADIIVAVDLNDGSRQLIAGSPTGRGTIATDPLAIDVDSSTGELYVVDFTENSLYSLSVATGARRTVANQTTGTGPLLDNPIDVGIDSTARVAYVLDARADALFAVDLGSGQRRIVAAGFGRPVSLELDLASGVAYVSSADGEIIRIELANGQRAVASSPSIGAGPRPGELDDIALDTKNNRLIALDLYPGRVLAIDLATGNRAVLSGPPSVNSGVDVAAGPRLGQPRMIAVDSSRQIAYVTENLYDAVIAIDLSSGYRQVIAR